MAALVTVTEEDFDAPDSRALRDALAADLRARYGGDSEPGVKPSAGDIAVFPVARDAQGVALGCGALRRLTGDGAEIKRMYTRPAARGTGVGGAVLAALERHARSLGLTHLLLETGDRQPESRAFYDHHGYTAVACYGPYSGVTSSRCYHKHLRTGAQRPRAAPCGAARRRTKKNRRRPTLPGPCGPSTIGAEGLNCSVRKGKRCFPLAITTGTGESSQRSLKTTQ